MPFHESFHEDLTFKMVLFYEGLILGWSYLMKISFKSGPFMKVSFYDGLIF